MRQIDADTLWTDTTRSIDCCEDFLEVIERQPTVDPVKHGRWIDTGEIFTDQFSLDEFPIYECSVCGSRIERKPTLDRFCNWCGARMDEEDK